MTTTSKLRLLRSKVRASKTAVEWRRLAEMPEPAPSSAHRPYWACARFLCAMHALSTCSRLLKQTRAREAGVSCNEVVGLGARAAEKRGPRHLEVFNLAYEYSEYEEPFDAAMLVGLRDELVIEEHDRWDVLSEREQAVLLEIDAADKVGVQSGELASKLRHHPGFAKGRPDRHGKALLRDLCDRGLLCTEGKGGYVRYKLHRRPAGWPG